VVYSEHGTESSGGGAEPRVKRWLRRLAYESAHQVFSVSYQLRDACAGRTGFSAARIGVIHNGVDTARYAPDAAARAAMRGELGLAEQEVCIGVVGRLEPVKDHATLFRAAAQLDPTRPWRIVVAGEGSLESQLRQMVSASPVLAGRVQFLGDTPRIAALLQAFDIYVLPSISEGISNSLLEAMSTGVPSLATAAGGNPEVLVAGESGLLFAVGADGELARYLHQWISVPSQRQGWGDRARQRVLGHFSLDAMMARYGSLYARLGAAPTARGVYTEEIARNE
ncbi:MAG: glycosyltransferase, partial [Bryobacterales bacterium]|nr:glycosyltransferase [Bryobacterales bacterium]